MYRQDELCTNPLSTHLRTLPGWIWTPHEMVDHGGLRLQRGRRAQVMARLLPCDCWDQDALWRGNLLPLPRAV